MILKASRYAITGVIFDCVMSRCERLRNLMVQKKMCRILYFRIRLISFFKSCC